MPRIASHPIRHEPAPLLTREHLRVQNATVARLQDAVEQAERYLRDHPERIEGVARDKLCPCGIRERDCQCPLRQANAHARGA